jgi:hypothetical protein
VKISIIVIALLAAAGALASAPAAVAESAPRTVPARLPSEPALTAGQRGPASGGPGGERGSSPAPPPARGRYRTISVPHAVQTTPEDVTDSGMIVGCYQPATGPTRGFTDRGGRFTTVTDPAAGHRSQLRGCVLGANSRGVLVGYYLSASGVDHAFVDRGGHFIPVDAPGAGRRSGEGTVAVDINDSGVVAGYYHTGRHGERGFVLRRGRFMTVRYPPGSRGTWASGVADNGTIAGGYTSRRGGLGGFLDAGGVFSPIAVPGAVSARGKGTAPQCISKHTGLVVGNYWRRGRSSRPTGFSYQRGAYRTLSDPAATEGTTPQCGNDSGQIVGVYYTGGAVPHGFEFTPRR